MGGAGDAVGDAESDAVGGAGEVTAAPRAASWARHAAMDNNDAHRYPASLSFGTWGGGVEYRIISEIN